MGELIVGCLGMLVGAVLFFVFLNTVFHYTNPECFIKGSFLVNEDKC